MLYWAAITFPQNTKTMIIITHFPDSIPEYVQKGKENYFPPIFDCANCSYHGQLHRHGFYKRNVLSLFDGYHQIYVARKICPVCGQTYSQIPDFLVPHFQYSYHTIITILTSMFLEKLSFLLILEKIHKRNTIFMSKAHLSYYKKRFLKSKSLIHLFFAQQPDFQYDMDFQQLSLPDIMESLMSKIQKFIVFFNNFNLTYFLNMPFYFFSPR